MQIKSKTELLVLVDLLIIKYLYLSGKSNNN